MKKQIKEFILEDDIRYIWKKNTKNNITINYNKELKTNILIWNLSLIFWFIYMISLFIIEENSKYINSPKSISLKYPLKTQTSKLSGVPRLILNQIKSP